MCPTEKKTQSVALALGMRYHRYSTIPRGELDGMGWITYGICRDIAVDSGLTKHRVLPFPSNSCSLVVKLRVETVSCV